MMRGSTQSADAFARLATPQNISDPYPFMAWLRENDPVHHSPSGVYLLSRHEDILGALKESGSSFRGPDSAEIASHFPGALRHRTLRLLADTLTMKNPPEHTRLRRLVSRDFTVNRIDKLRQRIEEISDTLLSAVAESLSDGGVADLHAMLSVPFPAYVFADLFGLPESDVSWLAPDARAIMEGLSPAATPDQLAVADAATVHLEEYFAGLVSERRGGGASDLISALAAANSSNPEQLTDSELMAMLWGMLLGGFTTTASAIDHGVLAMIGNPGPAQWLDGDLAHVKAFAEEVLRYEAPAMFSSIARIATEDTEIRGVTIPAGSDVRVLMAAGNRDPAAFPDPDGFDPARFLGTQPGITRDGSAVLTFGHGIHFCLGAHLSRTELATILPAIRRRLPGLALAADPVRDPSPFLRTLTSLPLRSGNR